MAYFLAPTFFQPPTNTLCNRALISRRENSETDGPAKNCRAGAWLHEHTDLRDTVHQMRVSIPQLREVAIELRGRIQTCGRNYAIPKMSARKLAQLENEARLAAAKQEQAREDQNFSRLPRLPSPEELPVFETSLLQ